MVACPKIADCEPGKTTVFTQVHKASAWLADDCIASLNPLEFDFSAECVGEFNFRQGEFVGEFAGPNGSRLFVFLGRVGLPSRIASGNRTFDVAKITPVYFCLGIPAGDAGGEEFLVPRKP